MGEQRCKPHLGNVQRVLRYEGKMITSCMMQVPMDILKDGQTPQGCFRFDGHFLYFNEQDAKYKKFIVYESVQQVQRTTRGVKALRLRP